MDGSTKARFDLHLDEVTNALVTCERLVRRQYHVVTSPPTCPHGCFGPARCSSSCPHANLFSFSKPSFPIPVESLTSEGGHFRLKKMPVPLVYTRHTGRFLGLWILMLPFALAGELDSNFVMIPISLLVAVFFFGIEELGIREQRPTHIRVPIPPFHKSICLLFLVCSDAQPFHASQRISHLTFAFSISHTFFSNPARSRD